ncbi:6-pyruvoyl trahydropterin synthase family protein [Mucisphaera calidilacus]|uniref:6-carboxy-5,6,7,8-tetrahydropterin synthase n=1 Tax=Mucisphaera calidilacus TaxID=2527982 RepID=A0A518C191_9BACT|nr:6-carboxytetrahydropterin synthase [Mucisphaera calidilacus]QDU72978.1 6-pyruvoyl tetrahydropterin synthase [Mucisphaera calidilacus]
MTDGEGGKPVYSITVTDAFAASHALRLANGEVEPLHGHNWEVAVTVATVDLDRMQAVMDFHDLQAVLGEILRPWRNAHLNECVPFKDSGVNPTAERVVWHIGTCLAEALPEGVAVESVSTTEAPGCTATYRPAASFS